MEKSEKKYTAWIISYTPVAKEPRVIRQASALHHAGWNVVVFGLKGAGTCPEWWNHVTLPENPKRPKWRSNPITQLLYVKFINLLRRSALTLIRFLPYFIGQIIARFHQGLIEIYKCRRDTIITYAKNVLLYEPEKKPSLILCHDYFTADIALKLKRKFKACMVIDCHEYAPDQYMHNPMWVKWHRPLIISLQQYYLSRADAVTTICDGIAKLLNDEYKVKRSVRVVRSVPFYNKQHFRPTTTPVTVLYHGEIYPSRDLHIAVRSLPLWRSDFRLVLRGYSDPKYVEELWQLANMLGVTERLSIEPPVSFNEIIPAANKADIGYFVVSDISLQRHFTLPNKFFEYIMAGLALCVSDLPEMAHLVRQYDLGLLVKNCDENSIAEVINSFDCEKINDYKIKCLEVARNLNWENEQFKMLTLYKELQDDCHR